MDNPYRAAGQLSGIVFERHPEKRNRVTTLASVRWHLPKARTTLEPRYRFYIDDWGIRGHSIDARAHFGATRMLRLRLRYRFYIQSESFFWRDDMAYQNSDERCERDTPVGCASADPKMDDWLSHTAGLQLTYSLGPAVSP